MTKRRRENGSDLIRNVFYYNRSWKKYNPTKFLENNFHYLEKIFSEV